MVSGVVSDRLPAEAGRSSRRGRRLISAALGMPSRAPCLPTEIEAAATATRAARRRSSPAARRATRTPLKVSPAPVVSTTVGRRSRELEDISPTGARAPVHPGSRSPGPRPCRKRSSSARSATDAPPDPTARRRPIAEGVPRSAIRVAVGRLVRNPSPQTAEKVFELAGVRGQHRPAADRLLDRRGRRRRVDDAANPGRDGDVDRGEHRLVRDLGRDEDAAEGGEPGLERRSHRRRVERRVGARPDRDLVLPGRVDDDQRDPGRLAARRETAATSMPSAARRSSVSAPV